MKEFRNPSTVHAPVGAYTHQIEVSGAQRWLLMSGQIGMKVDGVIPDDPVEQLEIALDNIGKNLQTAGMGIQDLVKISIYLVDPIDPARRREVLSTWSQGNEPCATLIYVAALATPNIKVEIDAWACV